MKSKTSFFKVSPAIIREDVRRFWAIPVLAFIGYFLFGILPILVDYHLITENNGASIHIIGNTVDILLSGQNPFIVLNTIWVPILSGILIFSYLHRTGTVMSVHSQPITRNTLFNSHLISSLLFGVLPVLAAGIILLIIAKPIYMDGGVYHAASAMAVDSAGGAGFEAYSAQQVDDAVNIFSRLRILQWMWDSCLVTLFILTVTIFGGMITGTTLHHFIAAIGFNVVVPAIYVLVKMYFTLYLYGYAANEIENVQYLSPVLLSCIYQPIGLKWSVIYLVVIAALLIFSMLLYSRRKLERATDGVVFAAANVGITLLFGFLGMSLMGIAFQWIFSESASLTVFGYICGAVLAMVIVRMIIMKTIKIFDRQFIKILIAYLIAAVLFFAVIVCDLTGFESRVPSAGSVDSVEFEDSSLYNYSADGVLRFEDEQSIALVEKLHEEIVENRAEYDESDFSDSSFITLTYSRGDKNGDDYKEVMKRRYDVPTDLLYGSEAYRALLESQQFNEALGENIKLDAGDIISGTLMLQDNDMPFSEESAPVDLTKEETQELYSIYRNELLGQNAQQRINRMEGLVYTSFSVIYHTDNAGLSSGTMTSNFGIKNTDTACIQWLREHGYSSQIESQMADEWSCAVISTITQVSPDEWDAPEFVRNGQKPAEDEQNIIVTDQEQMMKLYEKMRSSKTGISALAQSEEDQVYWLTFCAYEDGSEDLENFFRGYIAAADLPEGIGAPKGL